MPDEAPKETLTVEPRSVRLKSILYQVHLGQQDRIVTVDTSGKTTDLRLGLFFFLDPDPHLASVCDLSTGRPHDIVALQRALDESEAALTAAHTSMGAMRVQISVL